MMIKRHARWFILLPVLAGAVLLAMQALEDCFPFSADALSEYQSSTVLTDCHGRQLRVRLGAGDVDCRPVEHDAVSDWAGKALIAAEDKRFMSHGGVDPAAIFRAVCQNLFYGRRISGASTLSTQVIRLSEPRPRNLQTKVIEAVKSMQMEKALAKEDILEQHMNRAPFGSNLTGVESASRLYFGKSARDLSLVEAALLMGLPQSPSRLRPDRHPDAARKRMQYVLGRMERCGYITEEERKDAERQPVAVRMGRRPFDAPHFSDYVLRKTGRKGIVSTSLDSGLQSAAEQIVASHSEQLSGRGVYGAAVVVLEVKSGAVRAMIGSPDYFDREHAGAVNGSLASRSPGSALKPFIYAMALEQGMITPGMKIDDSPMHFRDGTPVNFDGKYLGPVPVRDALVLSLNIPALKVTEQLGQIRVVDTLRELGMATLNRSAGDYGLGIALGSGEVRLLDLVNAYACLARQGIYRPFRLTEDEHASDADQRIFSPETAYMIADMLGGSERNMDIFGHMADVELPRFAWKTGTSSGFRDAWTIAWNPEYVVGVWLGNPDGSGSPALVGAESAAPVAGDIFRAIYPQSCQAWYEKPAGIREKLLSDGTRDLFVPGISQPVEIAEKSQPLKIISPVDGSVFRIQTDSPVRQEIELKAVGVKEGEVLHWFANGMHIGTSDTKTALHWPLKAGSWTISCSGASGRAAKAEIGVDSARFVGGVSIEIGRSLGDGGAAVGAVCEIF